MSVSPATPAATAANPFAKRLLKLWVKWKVNTSGRADGGTFDFYSFDSSGRFTVADPRKYAEQGLYRRILEGPKVSAIQEAILYDNQTQQPLAIWIKDGVRLV